MDVVSTDPRTLPDRSGTAPVHHYHVVFWRQPTASEGRRQESVMWSGHYHEVVGAKDVHEVITWADSEAQTRKAAYTLYAVTEYWIPRNEVIGEAVTEFDRRELAVWIGGWDPVQSRDNENFERLLPPGAQPVGGSP